MTPQVTSKRQIFRGGGVIIASQVITMGLMFFAQRTILSVLTKEENGFLFGERRIIDLFLIILVDVGINIIAMRRSILRPDEGHIVLSSAVALRLALWIPSGVLAVGYGVISGFRLVDLVLLCVLQLMSAKTTLLRFLLEIPYRNKLKFEIPALLSILETAFYLGLVLFPPRQLTVSTVIAYSIVAAVPSFITLLLIDRGRYFHWKHIRIPEMKSLARESIPVAIMITLIALHDKMDAIMLNWWSTKKELGGFGAAYVSLAPLTTTIPIAVTQVVIPLVTRAFAVSMKQCAQYVLGALRVLVLVSVLASVVLTNFTPEVIELVSKGQYLEYVRLFQLFLWMSVPIFILVYSQEVIIALNQSKLSFIIGAVLAATTIIFGWVLIPAYQSWGAGVAKMLSVSSGAVVSLVLIDKALGRYADRKVYWAMVIPVAAAILWSTQMGMFFHRYVVGISGVVVVAAVSVLSGLARKSEIRMVLGILKKGNR
ncbi:MAG: hypothetical protein D8M52_02130 [Chlorobi bacterium]|nr:MAG: hypothetical protein F9K28_01745 [Bacteroidota bacterium]KXK35181.1 MAG: membrane protein [Chlorobi bacterium OLB6]MBL1160500.1 hypothetical protein [Chlorobiota bacterium]MBW7853251.1 hypothetical protein [Candidatus Kapabacteria bacterium]MCC6331260.1 hypothetical protein [Ignavibacteria bacterium]